MTPLRQQYLALKAQFPNAILFFQMGDFFEAFDQDAETIARELDLVLTSRNVSKSQRVPMAGVPRHAAEGYIARLIAKGHHVAVCEQTEDEPVEGLIPRAAVRVANPAPHADDAVGGAPVVERYPNGIVITRQMLDVPAIYQAAQAARRPHPTTLHPASTSLPNVPLLAGYHAAKQKHPEAIALIERGMYFYAYGQDARQVAQTLNAVLDAELIEGVRVERTAIAAGQLDHWLPRLRQAGLRVAVVRQKTRPAAQPEPAPQPAGHTLPATLAEAYARFRENRQPGALTFVEMADAFVSFEEDAISAAQRLRRPHGVRVLPGGPSLQVLSLPRGSQQAAFERLRKGRTPVALVNGRVELLAPLPLPEAPQEASHKPPLLPRRSPEQLQALSQGQLALL